MCAPNACKTLPLETPPRKNASSIRTFHSRRVRITRSWDGLLRAVTSAVRITFWPAVSPNRWAAVAVPGWHYVTDLTSECGPLAGSRDHPLQIVTILVDCKPKDSPFSSFTWVIRPSHPLRSFSITDPAASDASRV